jgi:hypothetical protein
MHSIFGARSLAQFGVGDSHLRYLEHASIEIEINIVSVSEAQERSGIRVFQYR